MILTKHKYISENAEVRQKYFYILRKDNDRVDSLLNETKNLTKL